MSKDYFGYDESKNECMGPNDEFEKSFSMNFHLFNAYENNYIAFVNCRNKKASGKCSESGSICRYNEMNTAEIKEEFFPNIDIRGLEPLCESELF